MTGFRFTEPFVRNAKTEKQKEFCEEGLCLRVYPSGRKVWFLPYRNQEGRFRRLKLGTYPALSLRQARGTARVRRGEVEQGADPQEERIQARLGFATFADLAAEYLEVHARRKKRSWKEDQRILEKDVLPAWRRREPASITRREIASLVEGIARRGAPIMANRTLALVGKIFAFATEREIVPFNPRIGLSMPAREKARERILSEEELRQVWRESQKLPLVMGSIYRFLLLTGQRANAVTGMRRRDVRGDVWTVPGSAMKSGHEHRVFLAPQALALLETIRLDTPEGEWAFPSWRKPGSPVTSMTKSLPRMRKLCGFHFTRHDLRRTFATHLSRLGCPRLILTKILDHTDASVTAIYDRHRYDDEQREWMLRWAEEVEKILREEE